ITLFVLTSDRDLRVFPQATLDSTTLRVGLLEELVTVPTRGAVVRRQLRGLSHIASRVRLVGHLHEPLDELLHFGRSLGVDRFQGPLLDARCAVLVGGRVLVSGAGGRRVLPLAALRLVVGRVVLHRRILLQRLRLVVLTAAGDHEQAQRGGHRRRRRATRAQPHAASTPTLVVPVA